MKKAVGAINPCCERVLLALAGDSEAQQPKKVPRIGYLSSSTS